MTINFPVEHIELCDGLVHDMMTWYDDTTCWHSTAPVTVNLAHFTTCSEQNQPWMLIYHPFSSLCRCCSLVVLTTAVSSWTSRHLSLLFRHSLLPWQTLSRSMLRFSVGLCPNQPNPSPWSFNMFVSNVYCVTECLLLLSLTLWSRTAVCVCFIRNYND